MEMEINATLWDNVAWEGLYVLYVTKSIFYHFQDITICLWNMAYMTASNHKQTFQLNTTIESIQ